MQPLIEVIEKYKKIALYVTDVHFQELLIKSLNNLKDFAVVDVSNDLSKVDVTDTFANLSIVYSDNPAYDVSRAVENLKRVLPETEVLAILDFDDFDEVMKILKSGASGVIVKDEDTEALITGIKDIMNGGSPLPRYSARKLVESFQRNLNSPLTSRETQVMEAISQGKSYKIIAQDLFVHPETIKTHMKNIYSKLNVNTKAEAIDVATRQRLI